MNTIQQEHRRQRRALKKRRKDKIRVPRQIAYKRLERNRKRGLSMFKGLMHEPTISMKDGLIVEEPAVKKTLRDRMWEMLGRGR